ncbi:hypothetical protein CRUP_016246 [Coryphaenoides rupestris]|nr:hypothetical protein CRUP_016246 [Coryphaenoides rupestris]
MAMNSSTVTEVNGMVVVTQVFPKAGGGEAEKRPPDSPVYAPAKVSAMTAAFLRGQPKALGIVQVFVGLIQATLGTHVMSVLVSLAGMVFLPWLLATQGYQTQLCHMEPSISGPKCNSMLWDLTYTLSGVWGLVLFLTVSEFCIAISLCVFSGRALSRSNLYMSHTMVIGAASPTSNLLDGGMMA